MIKGIIRDNEPEEDCTETIGLVLVHGIGEERRYAHLDGSIRGIIAALGLLADGGKISVEIVQAEGGANLAEHDSWKGGSEAPIRLYLNVKADHEIKERRVKVCVHEVWWADVNEPYSVLKQLRFWVWGNTVWNFPKQLSSDGALTRRMYTLDPNPETRRKARLGIFFASNLLLLTSTSVALVVPLLKRLLNIDAPVSIQVFVNFLSSIKLYNQTGRSGLGIPPTNADFLDALGEPPRVSVRRRMVQALADVACAKYKSWYVMAHSLGSVVAFNGLMEPAYVFANYLDQRRWSALVKAGLAGPTTAPGALPHSGNATIPARPLWIGPKEVADRPAMFAKFRGLITYGSPVGKFGAIWPARAPICLEPAFSDDSSWINVFDPLDPVSGVSDDYQNFSGGALSSGGLHCYPEKIDVGYATGNYFGTAHVNYLNDVGPGGLAYQIGRFILGGARPTSSAGKKFFLRESPRFQRRTRAARVWQIGLHGAATVLATATTGYCARLVLRAFRAASTSAAVPVPQRPSHTAPLLRKAYSHQVHSIGVAALLLAGTWGGSLLISWTAGVSARKLKFKPNSSQERASARAEYPPKPFEPVRVGQG